MKMNSEFDNYVEIWYQDFIESLDESNEEDICTKLDISGLNDLCDGLDIYQKVILHNPGIKGIPLPYEFISQFIEDNFNIDYDFMWDMLEDIVNHIIEYDDPSRFFEEMRIGGCKSGLIGMFIYNSDCKDFYVKYLDSLECFMSDLEDSLGININNEDKLPRYTFVCWVCYEELCNNLSNLFE